MTAYTLHSFIPVRGAAMQCVGLNSLFGQIPVKLQGNQCLFTVKESSEFGICQLLKQIIAGVKAAPYAAAAPSYL